MPPVTPLSLVVVFLGAGVGGVLRYLLTLMLQPPIAAAGAHPGPAPSLPWGTLVVNLTGCLAIGLLARTFDAAPPTAFRDLLKLGLLVGVLGGYTTFSSFGRETITLAAAGRWDLALTNVAISNLAGLTAVWIGLGMPALTTAR